MKDNKLNESKIGSAKVIVDILPKGKVIPNTKITPTSITIHNTGNINAPAKNNHNYMKNCNKNGERIASWHFTVDDKEIYQAQSTNYKCYHAGTSNGNNTSIGIEICMFNDKEKQRKTYENAIELVKILLKYYGWGIDKVKRHKDWSGKHCPAWLIEGKFGYTWDWFKKQLTTTSTQPIETEFKQYLAKCNTDGLNCREGAGTNYKVVRQINKGDVITIVEEKMNGNTKWLKAKSNYWISAKYMNFVRYV
jgi:N-acetylmuramoyl-L-alanine amidase CwlA